MDFDKSKYTAMNAEELEEGDVVFVADTLAALRHCVLSGSKTEELMRIENDTFEYLFIAKDGCGYALAYLIAKHDDPYKEFKKAQAQAQAQAQAEAQAQAYNRYSLTKPTTEYKVFLNGSRFYIDTEPPANAHVYYKTTGKADANIWCDKHQKFAEVAKAWESGAIIQHSVNDAYEWTDDRNPQWFPSDGYRVKPAGLKWTDLKCGDVITDDLRVAMVTAISKNAKDAMHIYAGNHWLNDTDVETNWTRVER